MAKEWILNSAMNRFQLNYSRSVGKVSEEIRKCSPRTIEEWEKYYFENVRTKDHIESLGRKLYIKITEVLVSEIEDVTEADCIDYIRKMVIDRTFDGYMTEKETIYGQLQDILGVKIEPAPDEWDRLYNVDFYIKLNQKYIGLQIKPAGNVSHIPQIFKEKDLQKATHGKFFERFGGHVFYVISVKENGKKIIQNKEVIKDLKEEINLLKTL